MTLERTWEQRIAEADPLVVRLWSEVKSARDRAFNRMHAAKADYERLEALLGQMRDAGMAKHLPTLEELTHDA